MPNRNPSPANAGPSTSHAGPSSATGASGTAAGSSAVAGTAAAPVAGGTSKPEIPWAFIDCPTDTLVVLISHMLDLLIKHNDQVVLTPDALTRFHSRAAPGISVIDYLRRIVKYTNMEKIPLLSLLSYIDITCNHLPTFTLSSLTVHRFLIAGVCAGSKAQCDVFCTNSHYAKVGGIKVGELNALEREFLRVTKWNLCCNSDLLQKYYSSLIKSHGGFTQAAEPTVPPFRPFPRSNSKPRASQPADEGIEVDENAAGPSGTSGLDAGQGADMPDEEMRDDEGQPGDGGDGMEQDEPERRQGGDDGAEEVVAGSGLDTEGAHAVPDALVDDPNPSSARPSGPTADTFQADQPQTDGMDVDPEPPDSGSARLAPHGQSDPSSSLAQSADSHTGSALHSFPSRSSLRTDASSSVPSSSASSIRRASIGGSSTFTVKQGGAASPRLDTTSASGSASGRSATQGSSGSHDHDTLPPATPPIAISNGSSGSRPSARSGMARSEGAIASSGQSADSSHAHHGPHGGKLLKHLVGGIFGKRHHHATPADSATATPSSSSGVQTPVANVPATGGNPLSRSIKRHVSGPTPSTTSTPVAGKPGGTSAAPGSTTTAAAGPHGDRVLSPRPGDRRERDAGPSPRMSPGLARTVTPRIRTRDEVSAEGVKS